jgi:hypothetical protein
MKAIFASVWLKENSCIYIFLFLSFFIHEDEYIQLFYNIHALDDIDRLKKLITINCRCALEDILYIGTDTVYFMRKNTQINIWEAVGQRDKSPK